MRPWDEFEEDDNDEFEDEISPEGSKWVDAALEDGWSEREAEELGREWDRQEENDSFKY